MYACVCVCVCVRERERERERQRDRKREREKGREGVREFIGVCSAGSRLNNKKLFDEY